MVDTNPLFSYTDKNVSGYKDYVLRSIIFWPEIKWNVSRLTTFLTSWGQLKPYNLFICRKTRGLFEYDTKAKG